MSGDKIVQNDVSCFFFVALDIIRVISILFQLLPDMYDRIIKFIFINRFGEIEIYAATNGFLCVFKIRIAA